MHQSDRVERSLINHRESFYMGNWRKSIFLGYGIATECLMNDPQTLWAGASEGGGGGLGVGEGG